MRNATERCTIGLWDSTIPGIKFDENYVSNYAKMFDKYIALYPRGEHGQVNWKNFVSLMKKNGKSKKYDCIIGLSGGTDSSYLLHLAKTVYGLRPLAVTLDNGWSSDTSVKNIKRVTTALKIDLETYVVEYEEMKDILKSYIKASLPWIDFPTDHAIKSILFRIAAKEKIKFILTGQDFRSEGTQPNEWTYGDSKQLEYIQRKFGEKKIQSFPNMGIFEFLYYNYLKGIKMIHPFYFLNYNKKDAQKILIEKYGWKYYGGHHHENIFTKFAIAYWLPKKFGIDKRIITLSGQILSGELTRNDGLNILKRPHYDEKLMEIDRDFIIKKLDMSEEEFNTYFNQPNKLFYDFPSYHSVIEQIGIILLPIFKFLLPQIPLYLVQLEERRKKH